MQVIWIQTNRSCDCPGLPLSLIQIDLPSLLTPVSLLARPEPGGARVILGQQSGSLCVSIQQGRLLQLSERSAD